MSESKNYQVFDSLQRGDKPRKHDVIVKLYPDGTPDIKSYELWCDKACEMPMEHAMRFLIDGAFKVISPSGKRIMPVPKLDLSKPVTTLADDEIIVKYSELSDDALHRRVKILPGSEDIKEGERDKLVAFMISYRLKLKGMTEGDRTLATMMAQGELGGAMKEDELESMFPKQKLAA